MLFDASAIIIPLLNQKVDILHPDNVSHLNGFASIWCSIENIFLAATAEGYACNLRVPLGNEREYAREVLDFPKDAPIVKQKIIDVKKRIHWNKFDYTLNN